MIKKILIGVIFLLGLIYILIPGPDSVEDFKPIPDSLKSKEVGDTIQVPNTAAYFSYLERKQVTEFYKQNYRDNFLFGKLIPPVSLNYPPLSSHQFIRDQQISTFLEEYTYPLRGSLFVNGYEPFIDDEIRGKKHSWLGDHIHVADSGQDYYFTSKATLRFYPDNIFLRLFIYLSIWGLMIALWTVFKRAIKEKY